MGFTEINGEKCAVWSTRFRRKRSIMFAQIPPPAILIGWGGRVYCLFWNTPSLRLPVPLIWIEVEQYWLQLLNTVRFLIDDEHITIVWTYPFWWIKKGEGGSSDTWLVFLQLRITHWKKSLISTELETNEHWKLPKNVHILTDADKNCEVPTVATHKYNKHH